MVSFTTLILTIAAAAASANAFEVPCNSPNDQCGWTLTNDIHRYTREELIAAHGGIDDGTLYNAVYNCREGGVIIYNRACPKGCNAAGGETKNANCIA
ncbi:hypothetical protein QBC34DRAFT_397130 [Podospora aff. communis PSN243]|uniref:Uncharacterized protein n=1 Tax=Podospora aff. communis PSN243 TaxID=3040156 RepID=A0AAV9GWW7_9PEZI|nr:hypothetical protein QBC34DRAFT_397130 [Podospora aff. communis PSN243]